MLPTVIMLGEELPGAEIADALSGRNKEIVLLDGSRPSTPRLLSSKAPVAGLEQLAMATDELLRAYGGADSVIACLDGWDKSGLVASGPLAALRILVSLFVHRNGGTLILVTGSNTNSECSRMTKAAAAIRGIVTARALAVRVIVVKLEHHASGDVDNGADIVTQLVALLSDPNAIEGDEIVFAAAIKP